MAENLERLSLGVLFRQENDQERQFTIAPESLVGGTSQRGDTLPTLPL
jgi:hypothetical protein